MTTPLLIADAGPLIALSVAGVLPQTIDLYKKLWVPEAVIHECVTDTNAPGAAAIIRAIRTKGIHTVPQSEITPLDAAYALGLGSGEAAVISYAAQHQHIALVDDRKARKIAQRLQVRIVGSGAILLALKTSGRIEKIAPALAAWQTHGYFVAHGVVNELLKRAGELNE
jgi:predicted nucleic acid-binding protein